MGSLSSRKGISPALVMVMFAVVGLTAVLFMGNALINPSEDLAETSEGAENSSQCEIWKSQTTTAGVEETDEYERKYNENCATTPIDEQVENGNFYSSEYDESEHETNFEDATSDCRIGQCRKQSVCLANGANIGESCGIGATCCTLEETKEIEYGNEDGFGSSDDPIGGTGSASAGTFQISLESTTTIPTTSERIGFFNAENGFIQRLYFRVGYDSQNSCGGNVFYGSPVSTFSSPYSVAKCGFASDMSFSSGEKTLGICDYDRNSQTATLVIFENTVSKNQVINEC